VFCGFCYNGEILINEKYVGGTGNTVPFDKAPSSVCGALALIKERTRLVLRRDIPFNEILSAAYMERQKMSVGSWRSLSRGRALMIF
jgi:hypothetical protein